MKLKNTGFLYLVLLDEENVLARKLFKGQVHIICYLVYHFSIVRIRPEYVYLMGIGTLGGGYSTSQFIILKIRSKSLQ